MKRQLQIEYQKVGSKTDAHRGGGRLVHHSNSLRLIPIVITIMGFPDGLAGKESDCNVRELGSVPGLERSPGEGNSYPLQYSGLENSVDCTGSMGSQSCLSSIKKLDKCLNLY